MNVRVRADPGFRSHANES